MTNESEFKNLLTEDLELIIQELNSIAVYDPHTDDWVAVPDKDDQRSADSNVTSDRVEEWNIRRAMMTQLETRYKNISRALGKIAAGTYGICEVCQGEIEPERLQANPAARTDITHSSDESQLPN